MTKHSEAKQARDRMDHAVASQNGDLVTVRRSDVEAVIRWTFGWENALDQLDGINAEHAEHARWKREATVVLERHADAWDSVGRPGRLGQDIGTAMADEINRLRAQLAELGWVTVEERERIRRDLVDEILWIEEGKPDRDGAA